MVVRAERETVCVPEVMLTQDEVDAESLPGLLAPEKCPAQLDLMTGLVGDRPRTLTPAHPDFAPFAWAWRRQDTWTTDEHRDYWLAHLHRWPRARQASTEMLAFALRATRVRGLADDDRQVDELLGYDDATNVKRMLRRRHHGRRLDDVPGFGQAVVSAWPLPRIWTPGEPPPDPHGYRLLLDREILAARAAAERQAAAAEPSVCRRRDLAAENGVFGVLADPRAKRIRERLDALQ